VPPDLLHYAGRVRSCFRLGAQLSVADDREADVWVTQACNGIDQDIRPFLDGEAPDPPDVGHARFHAKQLSCGHGVHARCPRMPGIWQESDSIPAHAASFKTRNNRSRDCDHRIGTTMRPSNGNIVEHGSPPRNREPVKSRHHRQSQTPCRPATHDIRKLDVRVNDLDTVRAGCALNRGCLPVIPAVSFSDFDDGDSPFARIGYERMIGFSRIDDCGDHRRVPGVVQTAGQAEDHRFRAPCRER
jgi:hypothetical protein